jgi:hypothetical protein
LDSPGHVEEFFGIGIGLSRFLTKPARYEAYMRPMRNYVRVPTVPVNPEAAEKIFILFLVTS